MAAEEDLARLKNRLRRSGAGAVTGLSNQTVSALIIRISAVVGSIREAGRQRPLTSILIAFQLAFVVAYWGPRRAKH